MSEKTILKYSEVKEKDFPVNVRLSTKNPWKGSIKVNNIFVSISSNTKISNKADFDKLLPIAKYTIIEKEVVEETSEVKEEVTTTTKKVSTRKKKSSTSIEN